MPQRPSLSACLIVKNEELHIRRCLRSLGGVVDEICVLDTGCTDRTIEIAEKEFGAKTAFRKWDDDFAAARNASLDLATGDWALQIDADEEFYQPHTRQLHELMERTDIDVINVLLRNFYNIPEAHTGESARDPMHVPHSMNHLGRVFRRLPHFRYTGCIHETIREATRGIVSDVSIFHYGYAQTGKVQDTRLERNHRLCKKLIAREPDSPAPYYYAATTCIVSGMGDEAEGYLRQAIEAAAKPGNESLQHFFLMSCYELANFHSRREEYAESQKLCEWALEKDPNYLDPWLRVGEAYFFQENYWAAERALRRYFVLLEEYRNQSRSANYSLYMLNSSDYAHFLLGRCAQEREDLKNAERHYQMSLELNSNSWGPYYFLSQVFELQGRLEEADAMFAQAKELNPEAERAPMAAVEMA